MGWLWCEVWGGLLHLSLPLWLGSRGLKVLSLLAGLHDHGGVDSLVGLIQEYVRVDIIRVGGGGCGRDVHRASEDVRDRREGIVPLLGGREVAEPAEGGKSLMEWLTVVFPWGSQSGGKPDWHKTGHEGVRFLNIGEFVDNEEDSIDILRGDVDILNKFREWGVIRQKPEVTRGAAKLLIHGYHAEEVADGGERGFVCMPSFIGQQAEA